MKAYRVLSSKTNCERMKLIRKYAEINIQTNSKKWKIKILVELPCSIRAHENDMFV